jgi:hypothetical protein
MRSQAHPPQTERALDRTLQEYFVGTLVAAGVDFYAIPDAKKFHDEDAERARDILDRCHALQTSIWNPKHSIYTNAIAPGFLILVVSGNEIVAFFSAAVFQCSEGRLGLFHSDVMVARAFEGRHLPSLAFQILERMTMERAGESVRGIVNLMVSGNLSLFSHFCRSKWIRPVPYKRTSDLTAEVLRFLEKEFPDSKLEAGGIIRGAWYRQNSCREQWPGTCAERWGFPADVSYDAGDVLVRTFELPRGNWDAHRAQLNSRWEPSDEKA